MDLSKHKLVSETENAWEVEGPRGRFKVAKKGLGKKLREQISQHFAQGGQVQPEPPPAAVPPPPMLSAPSPSPAAPTPAPAPYYLIPYQQKADALDDTASKIEAMGDPDGRAAGLRGQAKQIRDNAATWAARDEAQNATAVDQITAGNTSADALEVEAQATGNTDLLKQAQARRAEAASAQQGAVGIRGQGEQPNAPAMLPSHQPTGALDPNVMLASHQPTGTQPLPPLAATAAPAGAPLPRAGGPGGLGELDKAYGQAKAAAQAQADVVKSEAQATLEAQQQIEAKRQELADGWQKTWNGWQQRGDDLRQQIMDQKINPNRFFTDMSTGGKVSAAIGIILGGLGSGLTGGPNQAMDVIQRAIDRDIDAQKTDLGKKQTLLQFHMQQGQSLIASRELAKADMLDAAAAKLAMTATRFAGEKAQANASATIAALQKEAVITRQQVASIGLDNQLKALQLQMIPFQMQMTRSVLAGLNGGQQGGEYLPSRAPPPMGSDPTNPLKFVVEAKKDAAERTVPGPGGKPFLAYSADVAKQVRPALSAAHVTKKLLDDLKAVTEGSSGIPGTNAAAVYDKTRRQVAELWAQVNGQTSLSDTQFKNLEHILPSSWEAFWRSKDRFGPIERALQEKTLSLYDQAGLKMDLSPKTFTPGG